MLYSGPTVDSKKLNLLAETDSRAYSNFDLFRAGEFEAPTRIIRQFFEFKVLPLIFRVPKLSNVGMVLASVETAKK